MNNEQDNIDWGRVNQDAQQSGTSYSYETGNKTVFLKVRPGVHRLRILPTGNKLDRLPYLKAVQHSVQDFSSGNTRTSFAWCWDALWENLLSKPSDEEKKDNTLIGYLFKQGKLNNAEMKKFQEYGCPFCKAWEVMNQYGTAKELKNKFLKKEQYLWNVYWRATAGSGDNKIYVWGCSKTQFQKVINYIKICKEDGLNALNMESGHDLMLQANGEGLQRRYDVQFHPVPVPIDIGTQIPYDLAEVTSGAFKTYQEMVNMLKITGSKALAEIGYIIPGDLLVSGNGQVQTEPSTAFTQPQPVQEVKELKPERKTVEVGGVLYEQMTDGTLKPLF